MPDKPYDPFLFATEGYQHGYVFGQAPGRSYEIHLKNNAPTEAFQMNFLQRGEDRSSVENGYYFLSDKGMPWAINVGTQWSYPLEYMDIIYAYPHFQSFIVNQGLVDSDWYSAEKSNINNLFTD